MLFGATRKDIRVDELVEFFNGKIRDDSRVFSNSSLETSHGVCRQLTKRLVLSKGQGG